MLKDQFYRAWDSKDKIPLYWKVDTAVILKNSLPLSDLIKEKKVNSKTNNKYLLAKNCTLIL